MNLKEMREKIDAELITEIKNRKEELFRLRFRKVTDVVENPSLVRGLRKEIARLKTILRERALKKGTLDEQKDEKTQTPKESGKTPGPPQDLSLG